MPEIRLPALRSDDPIGVLAALGVAVLTEAELGWSSRLRWEGLGGAAVLDCPAETLEALAAALRRAAAGMVEQERLLAGEAGQLVTAPLSDGERKRRRAAGEDLCYDPMRMTTVQARDWYRAIKAQDLDGFEWSSRWAVALVGLLAAQKPDDPVRPLTSVYAPSGRQSLHQLLGDYLGAATRERVLTEALQGWRRVPGDAGANLDARALRNAADAADGKPMNLGVPGATWLALQAIPFFMWVGDGRSGSAACWRRLDRRGRPMSFSWPVWKQAVSRPGIEVLLTHGALMRTSDVRRRDHEAALRALGVVAICRATRGSLRNSEGPLGPADVLWAG